MSTTITLEEFMRVELRVAKVLDAERIPGTKKLLKLTIDLGGETRQIVAGIGEVYKPEELKGRLIVVVANLAPKKIRGVVSQGMLLAADAPEGPVLIVPEREVKPGTRVR